MSDYGFSENTRVPTNTHPSHLPNYGALDPSSIRSEEHQDDHEPSSPGGRSFRSAIDAFTGSYSRAAGLYVAESLTLPQSVSSPPTIHGDDLDDEEHFVSSSPKMRPSMHQVNEDSMGGLKQTLSNAGSGFHFTSLSRHTTVASVISHQFQSQAHGATAPAQKSTFIQSVFNSVNVLVGIGILALPLAFRCAGWLFGSLIFLFCAWGTNYTAKLLARSLDASYAGASTYGDMGAAAFGDRGRAFVSSIFCVELMTIGVALVILLGDGLQSLFSFSLLSARFISFLVLTPMLFLPIRKLAYASLLGIVSSACLVVIVIYDGLSKEVQPGSLMDPMATEFIPSNLYSIPLSFGLMMAGFSGHAVFPSIYRDMDDPKQYERMVDITYFITVSIYVTMAVTGYLMFGLDTLQEITQNLANTPGYNELLNRSAVWIIVLTPLAKYGLMMNPVNVTCELWLASLPSIESWCKYQSWRKTAINTISRVFVSAVVVYVATVFPGFDRVMSLLGALFSFGISAIFPLACYRRLYEHSLSIPESLLNWLLTAISVFMAVMGTIWSFLPPVN